MPTYAGKPPINPVRDARVAAALSRGDPEAAWREFAGTTIFRVVFRGPGGFTGVQKVEARSALEAVENARDAPILVGTSANVLGDNLEVDRWRFVYDGERWQRTV